MTKAELQVGVLLLTMKQCDQELCTYESRFQILDSSCSITVLQARLEQSERSGAKDSEEDFAGILLYSP